VDGAVDGIITIDSEGSIELFNPAAEQLFGYSADEVCGKNVRLLMAEPECHAHDGYLRRYLDTGQATIIGKGREVIGKRKDGSLFAMDLSVSEMLGEGARRLIGIVRDVTEEKAAQDQIRYQKALLESQIESSIDGILVVDGDRNWVSYNQRFLQMWGLTNADLAHGSSSEIIDRVMHLLVDPQAFRDRVEKLYQHPGTESRDTIGLRDGRTIDRFSAAIATAEGMQFGRVWYYRNVTAEKRYEHEIAESAERLRLLVEGPLDAVITIAGTGEALEWNARASALFGWSAEEAIGRALADMIVPHQHRTAHKRGMENSSAGTHKCRILVVVGTDLVRPVVAGVGETQRIRSRQPGVRPGKNRL
jgi:PAS domain S-box-containing protein